MRGSRRKSIARYVDTNFPMLSKTTVYTEQADGTRVCQSATRRAVIQHIKNNYKKKQKGLL